MTRYFHKNEAEQWEHWIDDVLRATISEENLAAYKQAGGYSDDPVK